MKKGALNVWQNDRLVGLWAWTRSDEHRFVYDDAWLAWPGCRPLSRSLPITVTKEITGNVVRNYFDNLLPDSDSIRRRIKDRFSLASGSTQELLSALGRDCVGAVQLLPVDDTPENFNRINCTPVSEADIERYLHSASGNPMSGVEQDDLNDFRISIAGAQEKAAFLWYEGRWCHPHGVTPTSHIFKLPLGLVGNMRANMMTSVENEWLCLKILKELGFPVAEAEIATFGEQKVLIVERFDRKWNQEKTRLYRLAQEDFCQAWGLPSGLKYESEGGPGIAQCLELLSGSENAQKDKLTFAMSQLAFWLLGATDGHAKNFSIGINAGGAYQMTPLYDVLSAWPVIGDSPNLISPHRAKLAMAIRSKNAHYKIMDIQPRHWEGLAKQSGVAGAFEAMITLVESIDSALNNIEKILPRNFPFQVWESVTKRCMRQRDLFTCI